MVASAYDTQSFKWNDVAGRRVMADGSTPYAGYAVSAQDQVIQPWQGDVAYNAAGDDSWSSGGRRTDGRTRMCMAPA